MAVDQHRGTNSCYPAFRFLPSLVAQKNIWRPCCIYQFNTGNDGLRTQHHRRACVLHGVPEPGGCVAYAGERYFLLLEFESCVGSFTWMLSMHCCAQHRLWRTVSRLGAGLFIHQPEFGNSNDHYCRNCPVYCLPRFCTGPFKKRQLAGKCNHRTETHILIAGNRDICKTHNIPGNKSEFL